MATGAAIKSTARALLTAKMGPAPESTQIINVMAVATSTTGIIILEILSAIPATGALLLHAPLTVRMICDNVESFPSLVTLHFTYPDLLMVDASTLSPMVLFTDIMRPVSSVSLIEALPSMTTPSAGLMSVR